MRSLLFTFISVGVMSCVTPADEYSNYLDSFVGKKKKTLVKKFGVPDKVMELEDEDIYVYVKEKGAIGYGYGVDLIKCFTQFTLKDDVVSEWEWNGNCP